MSSRPTWVLIPFQTKKEWAVLITVMISAPQKLKQKNPKPKGSLNYTQKPGLRKPRARDRAQ